MYNDTFSTYQCNKLTDDAIQEIAEKCSSFLQVGTLQIWITAKFNNLILLGFVFESKLYEMAEDITV